MKLPKLQEPKPSIKSGDNAPWAQVWATNNCFVNALGKPSRPIFSLNMALCWALDAPPNPKTFSSKSSSQGPCSNYGSKTDMEMGTQYHNMLILCQLISSLFGLIRDFSCHFHWDTPSGAIMVKGSNTLHPLCFGQRLENNIVSSVVACIGIFFPMVLCTVVCDVLSRIPRWDLRSLSLKVVLKSTWLTRVLDVDFITLDILNLDYFPNSLNST